jgi:hypothetical protein
MSRKRQYTKEDCKQKIKDIESQVEGKLTAPKYEELNEDGPSLWVIRQRFGTWNKGKEESGVAVVDQRKGLPANYTYFSEVDTTEQAYWVGFIYGDGCISPNGCGNPTLSLNLNKRDRHILEDFRDAIDSEHSISESGDEVSIGFVNDKITSDLENLGASRDKTHTNTLPNFEERDLRAAFVRGLGDADAHPQKSRYSITGANRNRFEKLSKWLPVESKIHTYKENKHRLRVTTHKRVEKLRDWLYPDGIETSPSLERKKKEMLSYNY